MNVSNITGGNFGYPMHGVSGASPYVPSPESNQDPAVHQMRANIKQNSQDFKALKTALQANDMTAAAQAFAALQQDIQKASKDAGGKSPFDPESPIGKDFQALGEAIKSGDASAAKQAFATFRHDIQRAGHMARAHRHQDSTDGDANDQNPPPMPPPPPSPGSLLDTLI